ncbi:hypothetical protein BS78_05G106500 [Paspalum vaginatum]|nr:hypothetical protein BS78_05G106500 [Paspalum vaginatum]
MFCSSLNTHHTTSCWFLALVEALLVATTLTHQSSHAALLTNSSSSSSPCRPEQAAALLQLKGSFSFTADDSCPYNSSNTTLPSWIEGTDCCSWEGVGCDHVSGSVSELDLSSRDLCIGGGGLHPALFSLTWLKHLNLDRTNFGGAHLPATGFERLTNLEDLILSSCNLSGPIPDASLSGLRSLRTINLGWNNFSGSTFPLGITYLKRLEVLDLRGMSLSGPIPSSIGNLSSLTKLYLGSNDFSGAFPSTLNNLTYLSELECLSCGLSGRVPSLANLLRLQYVDLSQNNLEGPIPLSDGNILPNLQTLELRDNAFTGTIPASIFTLPQLQNLDFSMNRLSGHIEEFKNPSTTLEEISLFSNNLSGTIPTSFSQLRALIDLSLDYNNFMGTLDLYPYLMLKNFTSFSASYNPMLSVSGDDRDASTNSSIIGSLYLGSCGLTRLPSVIKYLPKLDTLDLSNNNISGKIPDWIWRNMSRLFLQNNLFTKVGQLPAYTSIYEMNLSFNKLGGPVPFPFEAQNLDYSNNKFSSIPAPDFLHLFRHPHTSLINLANNELSGTIPYAECSQDDVLSVLDLSGNNLSGSVPPYLLQGCGNALAVLNLRGNHLGGTWPDEIGMGQPCYLTIIDLHGNHIEGRLPRSLASCEFLQALDVGGNKFVDVFPSWLGNLQYLQLLILRSNKFYGQLSIPIEKNHSAATGYFSDLQIIDLAGNSFNGALPWEIFNAFKSMVWPQNSTDSFFGTLGNQYMSDTLDFPYSSPIEVAMKQRYLTVPKVLKDLVVIDLSNNRFTGSIPKTIGNLVSLIVLNMSNNALDGNIPGELSQLSKVESLDLSWNHLTGNIPEALASLTNLAVLNLSYNDLSGRIPTGSQFSTFTASSFQGGNQGLYGCPLPVRCNLTDPSSSGNKDRPPSQHGASAAEHRFEVVILCIFVGSGYGVGIAMAIVLQMACCGRHISKLRHLKRWR